MVIEKNLEKRPDEFDIVAVDSDLIVYKSAFAVEKVRYKLFDNEGNLVDRFDSAKACKSYIDDLEGMLDVDVSGYTRESEKTIGTEEDAIKACDTMVANIKKNVKGKQYKFYLTGKGNYREEISKTLVYKGNREEMVKPVHYQVVKDHLINHYDAILVNGAEADDACTVIGAKGYYNNKINTCVVTADKDLLGSPGYLYNFMHNEWVYQDELEADRFFFKQLLTGDKAVDTILGLENVSQEFRDKYGLKKTKGFGKDRKSVV